MAIYSLKFRTVHASCVTHSTETAQLLAHATSQLPTPGFVLTKRKRAVLALMVEMLNNTQIAVRLTVSPFNVKSHLSCILQN